MDDNLRIWRNFKLGKLVDLIILDTRQYDRSITDTYAKTKYINKIKDDASRTLMGSRQEAWLQRNLIKSAVLTGASSVVKSTLHDNNSGNNIVIAGDTHVGQRSGLARLQPIRLQQGAGAIGVEFGGAAKTTVSVANDTSKLVFTDSESLHWSEGYYRAYFELYITPEQVGAQFFGMPTSKERNAGEISWLTELLRAATIVWSGTRIMWPLVEW
ncbi:hypothetical protein N7533_008378 [Penicillium manginii]|uniref:uncharacterized protein n=1 Tax=Penicillium manginii TaxID=203109 RepID=UPI002548E7A2|nr:uncharacterized protein N7533_008378 [Penicillium manginii]KAJ5751350.1 hypothetical protein N7533_008378 [Penicillium manginii]